MGSIIDNLFGIKGRKKGKRVLTPFFQFISFTQNCKSLRYASGPLIRRTLFGFARIFEFAVP